MGWGADNPPGGPLVAPAARRVDMLSGDVAPTKYFQALSEADNLCREVDGLRELQCRLAEVELELAEEKEWHGALLRESAKLRQERDRARAERDTANLRAGVNL